MRPIINKNGEIVSELERGGSIKDGLLNGLKCVVVVVDEEVVEGERDEEMGVWSSEFVELGGQYPDGVEMTALQIFEIADVELDGVVEMAAHVELVEHFLAFSEVAEFGHEHCQEHARVHVLRVLLQLALGLVHHLLEVVLLVLRLAPQAHAQLVVQHRHEQLGVDVFVLVLALDALQDRLGPQEVPLLVDHVGLPAETQVRPALELLHLEDALLTVLHGLLQAAPLEGQVAQLQVAVDVVGVLLQNVLVHFAGLSQSLHLLQQHSHVELDRVLHRTRFSPLLLTLTRLEHTVHLPCLHQILVPLLQASHSHLQYSYVVLQFRTNLSFLTLHYLQTLHISIQAFTLITLFQQVTILYQYLPIIIVILQSQFVILYCLLSSSILTI